MGLLSKSGEIVGGLGGSLVGMVGDITKAGGSVIASIFKAADPEDTLGLIGGVQNAAGSAIDGAGNMAQKGLASAGSAVGQVGDDMLMNLAKPLTPSVPGFDDKNKGIV